MADKAKSALLDEDEDAIGAGTGEGDDDDELVDMDAVGAGFKPAPKGRYPAHLYEWDGPHEGEKGKYIKVVYEITGGGEGIEGTRVWKNYSYSQNALRFMKQHLAAMGIPIEELTGKMRPTNLWTRVSEADPTFELEVKLVPEDKARGYAAKNEVVAIRPAKAQSVSATPEF